MRKIAAMLIACAPVCASEFPSDADTCGEVVIASPALLEAQEVETAKRELRPVDTTALERARIQVLTVSYVPKHEFSCSGITPKRIVLTGPTGKMLESVRPVKVFPVTLQNALGAAVVFHNAEAEFDLARALDLSGGQKLQVGVVTDGHTWTYNFGGKKLKKLQ